MNVAFDPWIPTITAAGEKKLASLCAVLQDGEQFADLAVRPHERVALMRLLLCVAHAALDGPKDYDEWCEVPKRLPEACQRYLSARRDSFELFGPEKPWLQVAELSKEPDSISQASSCIGWTPVSKLNFAFATGNNSTLFDHAGMGEERAIPLAETIVSMLGFQCFSPGGLISQVYWRGKQTTKSSKDAPCVPVSMVHAFLRGKDLGNTIHLNLPTYQHVGLSYGPHEIGKPVWEMVPTSPQDSPAIANATFTYLGRLVPMTRVIRLEPSGKRMLLGDGFAYPSLIDGFPAEPSATVIKKDNGNGERTLLSFRPAKALWRELGAIVVKRNSDGAGGPLSLKAIDDGIGCDLLVAALARDQATILDTRESLFHISSRFRTPEGVVTYEAEVKSAEAVASRLGWAIETYRSEIDGGWEGRVKSAGPAKGALKAKLHSIATSHYWTTIEKNLYLLMGHIEALGTDNAVPSREAWRKMLFASACEAYRIACGRDSPRRLRAFAKGWHRLVSVREESEAGAQVTKEVDV